MGKQMRKRLTALLLTLCIAVGMAPCAAAAAPISGPALDAIQKANRENNFEDSTATAQLRAAAPGGIVQYTFPEGEGDFEKDYRYAAILPTNAGDKDVRYVRLEGRRLTYRRDGCREFAVMRVRALPDAGTAAMTTEPGKIEHYMKSPGATYAIKFTATVEMSDQLAWIVDINQMDPEMKNLKFVSHIRFDPSVGITQAPSDLALTSSIFDKDKLVVTPAAGGESGFDVECVLLENWNKDLALGETLVDRLMEPMTYTGTITVKGDNIAKLNGALYTVGWNTIEGIPAEALGGTKIQAPAVTHSLPLAFTDDLVVEVGDGNGNKLENATVTLTLVTNETGEVSEPKRQDTNEKGLAEFERVPYGTYKIDVSYPHKYNKDDPDEKEHLHNVSDTVIFYQNAKPVEIIINLMPGATEVTSGVNTETTNKTQSASASGLQGAMDVQAQPSTDTKVHLELTVTKEEHDENDDAKKIVSAFNAVTTPREGVEDQLVIPDFIDATVEMTVTVNGNKDESASGSVTQTDKPIKIYIPVPDTTQQLLDDNNLSPEDILTFRLHETEGGDKEIIRLSRISVDDGRSEGFYTQSIYNDGSVRHYIVIQAKKFSVYAFGVQLGDPSGNGSGSGSGGGTNKYPIHVEEKAHGSVNSSHKEAAGGTKVTITVRPDEGYRVGALTVTAANGAAIEVTDHGDGTYTFVMPYRGVTVTAFFVKRVTPPSETGVADLLNTEDHIVYMIGYDSGNFGPNDDVTRAQVVMMFYRLLKERDVEFTVSFDDVPEDSWYAAAVNTLAALGIVNGVGDGRFAPERVITRAEFAAIAVRFSRAMAESDLAFSDVSRDFWAHDYIVTAAAYGWVEGVGEGRFVPLGKISRAQAATIINRMTDRAADQAAVDRGEGAQFPDVTDKHWAWYDIKEATTGHDYTRVNGLELWKNLTNH